MEPPRFDTFPNWTKIGSAQCLCLAVRGWASLKNKILCQFKKVSIASTRASKKCRRQGKKSQTLWAEFNAEYSVIKFVERGMEEGGGGNGEVLSRRKVCAYAYRS